MGNLAAVIRIEAVSLRVVPLDMRAGMEAALARVITVLCAAQPHHAYPCQSPRKPHEGVHPRWDRHLARLAAAASGAVCLSRRHMRDRDAVADATRYAGGAACRGIVLVRQAL